MLSKKIVRLVCAVAALMLCLTGCSLTGIPLSWDPSEPAVTMSPIDLTAYQGATFNVLPFQDMRTNRPEIGRNIEEGEGEDARLVTTEENVGAWVGAQVAQALSDFDLEVAPAKGAFQVEGEVLQFYVLETSQYEADVILNLRVKSRAGHMVWQGKAEGKSILRGRSYKAKLYYHALGNALLTAVHGVLRDESFLRAVKQNK